jgi:hypothetical protein
MEISLNVVLQGQCVLIDVALGKASNNAKQRPRKIPPVLLACYVNEAFIFENISFW